MFDKKLVVTGIAIGLIVVSTVFLCRLPTQTPSAEMSRTLAGVSLAPQDGDPDGETPEFAYIMREHDGYIAVFARGETEPQMVLDTPVRFLPDYDRMQLQQGILIKDYAELASLIEDYIS